ncbi:hypothetical protein C8R44DRAFT_865507 [Mycena epipterygia]|nr:hypothetical protein C8R44DRAFT_865507 [Mycena epipterygia]
MPRLPRHFYQTPSHQDAPLPPFQHPGIAPPLSASQTSWPTFPRTYWELFKFQMPLTALDFSTTKTTAPWSGAQLPPVPLCYSYQDASIPRRALNGLEVYLKTYDLWERPTPNDARTSWRQLWYSYQGLPMTQESWLSSVLTILNSIATALLKDLGLAYSLLTCDPHLQFSQHGDTDWLATGGPLPDAVQALVEVMATAGAGGPIRLPLDPPISPPTIGGGCAFELKLSKVLLEYSHFFAEPFNTFRPLSNHVQGCAIVFKLDLQMQNRVIARRVSSYAPRYGIIYTGQYFLLAENGEYFAVMVLQFPQMWPFPRGPPLTSPTPGDARIRGVGVSRIEHIVGGNDSPFPGFLALLVAINARPGMLNIEDPDPQLALPGFTAYNKVYYPKNPQAGPGWGPAWQPYRLPPSLQPRTLVEVPRNVMEAALSCHPSSSADDYCSPSLSTAQLLFVDTCIQCSHQASVYRGRLDGRRVIVKVYEELGFDGLLREVRAYERLLSPSTTLKYLGVFVPLDKAWAALIVEDKGISLASDWAALPRADRTEAIYKAAVDVHAAGVYHGDLEVRNIVQDEEGRFSVVDFGHATVDHACEQDVCAELLDLRQNLGL